MNKERKKELQMYAVEVRELILRATNSSGTGHSGGSLSSADYFTYLYNEEIRVNPKEPKAPERDRFV